MLLSIIIPCYNSERFISATLDMLVSQELSGCEVIVVNDGSSDSTRDICESYCKRYNFVRLINQENMGESGARNTGIENASGEYIYFLDSDDSLAEGSINHFVQVIQANPGLDLYCFAYTSTRNGEQAKDYKNAKLDSKKFDREQFLKNYLAKHLPIHVCSCVIKRKLIEKCLLRFSVGLKIGADIEWLLNVGSVLSSAYFSNRVCYVYQIRDDSIMQGYKTYSMAQYHSFEIRRDIVLSERYRSESLARYSNFWIENQLLSNIVYYLKSSVKDNEITNKLIADCNLFRLPIVRGNITNFIAIIAAKILPMRMIIKIAKQQR